MSEIKWEALAAKIFCVTVLLAAIWIGFKYIIGILLPFAIAIAVSAIVYPLSVKSAKKTGLPQKLLAFIYVVLLLIFLGVIITFIINRLVAESSEFLSRVEFESESIISSAGSFLDFINKIISKIPFLRNVTKIEGAEEMLSALLKNIIVKIGGLFTSLLGALIINTPSTVIAIIVSIIACVYLSMDLNKLSQSMASVIPKKYLTHMQDAKKKVIKALKNYAKAYLIIFLITLGELFIGLWVLKRKYAFLMALLTALIDLLPILGTGIILIPWGLILILSKEYSAGFGILILYAIVTVVRQIAEPHFVGEKLGLHPIVSLFAMFTGWKLFGITGMLLAPLAATLVKEILPFYKKDGKA